MPRPRIACIVGTRPDAIKTMPLHLELLKRQDQVEPILISTGQHREMLDQVFASFGVQPNEDLGLMKPGQSLAELSWRAMEALDQAFERWAPDMVIAQGDTSTTFVASLTAFYRRIPFGHNEAGLRTGNLDQPFPEEFNRRAAAITAAQHYAPTQWAADNLIREHVDPAKVFVTGNTGIDAVLMMAEREPQTWLPDHEGRVLLLTAHRRENWGEPMANICRAALRVVNECPDAVLIVAMHRNPVVRETIEAILGGHPRIQLIEPPEHPKFVKLMQRATLILSDSGGVQEEAPTFGVPVLVLRETTERPEGVDAGCAELVGTHEDHIFERAMNHLQTQDRPVAQNPYGDGNASKTIADLAVSFVSG